MGASEHIRKKSKFVQNEVRITRASVALFAFLGIAACVWLVSHLRLPLSRQGWWMLPIAGVPTLVAGFLFFLARREKKTGRERVFSRSFWCFLCATLAGAMLFLVATMPVDYWTYSVPLDFLALILTYIIYVFAWYEGGDFRRFSILAALLGFGCAAMYQNYFSPKQITISTALLSARVVYTIGWWLLAAAALALVILKWKKKTDVRIWKDLVLLAFTVLYWMALSHKWWKGMYLSLTFGGVLFGWFVLLRIFKRFKVIR